MPVLNSAFYALNSSYYARWYYMPTLILAAMTVNALEDPDIDLDAPARGIGWIMLATLVFAVVPVRDDTTETWSFGVLKNPGQLFVVLGFGLNEVYIMSPHWLFVLPIAMGFALLRLRGRWLLAARVALMGLSVFLLAYNASLYVQYLFF